MFTVYTVHDGDTLPEIGPAVGPYYITSCGGLRSQLPPEALLCHSEAACACDAGPRLGGWAWLGRERVSGQDGLGSAGETAGYASKHEAPRAGQSRASIVFCCRP